MHRVVCACKAAIFSPSHEPPPGNYLTFYERALSLRNGTPIVIDSVKDHKFQVPAKLGSKLTITVNERADGWYDMLATAASADGAVEEVCNSALVRPVERLQTMTEEHDADNSKQHVDGASDEKGMMMCGPWCRVFADECNAVGTPGLPVLTVMKYFERARTDSLGGPHELAKFDDLGYTVVVRLRLREREGF